MNKLLLTTCLFFPIITQLEAKEYHSAVDFIQKMYSPQKSGLDCIEYTQSEIIKQNPQTKRTEAFCMFNNSVQFIENGIDKVFLTVFTQNIMASTSDLVQQLDVYLLHKKGEKWILVSKGIDMPLLEGRSQQSITDWKLTQLGKDTHSLTAKISGYGGVTEDADIFFYNYNGKLKSFYITTYFSGKDETTYTYGFDKKSTEVKGFYPAITITSSTKNKPIIARFSQEKGSYIIPSQY